MFRCSLLVAIASVACSSASTPKHCDDCGTQPMNHPVASSEDRLRKELCAQAAAFQEQGCSPFTQMDPALLADCSVVDSIYIATIDRCMGLTPCEAFQDCANKIRLDGGTFEGPTTSCDDVSRVAVPAGFDPADLERSTGRHDTKVSDTVSTPARPIEVCGMPDQLGYLMRVTCKDGSKPFANRAAADHARVGGIDRSGRCQRSVDEYKVPCPEQTYEVFIDPYRCPRR